MSSNDQNLQSQNSMDNDESEFEDSTTDSSEEDVGSHYGDNSDTTLLDRVYKEKLNVVQKQLQQLQDGTHVEYVKQLNKLDEEQKQQIMMNNLWRDSVNESIERDFIRRCRQIHNEFEIQKNYVADNLVAELNDRKKAIEQDSLNIELSPNAYDHKPGIRKLRRRQNESVIPSQVAQDKRRKLPVGLNVQYLLNEHEINMDIQAIQESCYQEPIYVNKSIPVKPQITTISTCNKIPTLLQNNNSLVNNSIPKSDENSDSDELTSVPGTRIEGGKLLFEKIWFHRGQPVFIEGTKVTKFPAIISAISNEIIWVKKTDSTKFSFKLSHLVNGKVSIKRRAVL